MFHNVPVLLDILANMEYNDPNHYMITQSWSSGLVFHHLKVPVSECSLYTLLLFWLFLPQGWKHTWVSAIMDFVWMAHNGLNSCVSINFTATHWFGRYFGKFYWNTMVSVDIVLNSIKMHVSQWILITALTSSMYLRIVTAIWSPQTWSLHISKCHFCMWLYWS